MTRITGLKLKNFKSFRKAEIPISEGFTAIAGANASGKSNVLDSILFALGATSLKMLRASRLTELVNHDASENYAKVELRLKDTAGKEIMLTRIIDKSGKSIYKLDDRKKTLNEIQSLLIELGISPNGHNIVVQGDITRIIEMNAKQRLEIIQEAAGLQEFEEKKIEALKKLEQVDARVKDTMLILKERETYLQQIENDRNNALRFNALQEEMKRSKATILSEELRLITKEIDSIRQSLERMQKDCDDKRSLRDKLQQEEIALEQKSEEITKKLIEASERIYNSFGREAEQGKAQIGLIEEKIRAKNDSIQAKSQRRRQLESEIMELNESSAMKSADLKIAEHELEKIREELSMLGKRIEEKTPKEDKRKIAAKADEDRVSELTKEIEGLKEELHNMKLQRSVIQSEIHAAENSAKEFSEQQKRVEARLAEKKELDRKITELRKASPTEKLRAKEKQLEENASQINSMSGRIQSLSEAVKSLSKVRGECPTCERPIEEAKKKSVIDSRGAEIKALKEKIAKLEAEKPKIISERDNFREMERQLSSLILSQSAYSGIEDELKIIMAKIASAKELTGKKRAENAGAEETGLESSIGELENERSGLLERIKAYKLSDEGHGFNELVRQLKTLNEQKSQKEHLVIRLSTEITEVISKKVSANTAEVKAIDSELIEMEKMVASLEKEMETHAKSVKTLEAQSEKAQKQNRLLEEEKARINEKIARISEKRDALSQKIEAREKEINELNMQYSKDDVRQVDLQEEQKQFSGIEPFKEFTLNGLKKRIPEIEKEIERLGAINMKSLENFDSFKKEVDIVREKAMKLDEERKSVLDMIAQIEGRKLGVFMQCFTHVSSKFSELYYKFFEGEGLLELSNRETPFEGGLLIQAKYKEDTLKSIDAMSGGEKSLTALAFLFALQSFTPAPFYILDEVDAALDKSNSVKVGRMIKEQCQASQFIVISHNDSVINQADQIIGVALNRKKSSVIGLKLKKEGDRIIDESGKSLTGDSEDGNQGAEGEKEAREEDENEPQPPADLQPEGDMEMPRPQ